MTVTTNPERASLLGRSRECALLDDLLSAVRRGESRSLVLRGEAGIGKTALLDYLVESASDLSVARAEGVESEMELAYAGPHQLCAPVLHRLLRLPAPHRHALEIVFGVRAGEAPDRLHLGLAVLGLLSEVAEERPLLCVVDGAQWVDQSSALTLAFVARRLLGEPVGLVFAAREPGQELRHVTEMWVRGLQESDARALVKSSVPFRLDERVGDQIIAETRGNPLALIELPRGCTATQVASGVGLLGAKALSARIVETFVRRLKTLSEEGGRLLLLAAAEPVGDPLLLWRPAGRLGVGTAADEVPGPTSLRWGWLTVVPSYVLWDEVATRPLCERQLRAIRDAGALGRLMFDLGTLNLIALRCGDLAGAAAATAERDTIVEATGTALGPSSAMLLAAFRGREVEARELIESARGEAIRLGQGPIFSSHSGRSRCCATAWAATRRPWPQRSRQATTTRRRSSCPPGRRSSCSKPRPGATRPEVAHTALTRILAATAVAHTDSARGLAARSRALMSEGVTAEGLYRKAIERLGHSWLRPELARAHLLYGEWLRREARRVDAREQLRIAYGRLRAIGMEAFAERTRRELQAPGEKLRKRSVETRDDLTAHERQIAQLACDGLSNPEIGARLFVSPRTVEGTCERYLESSESTAVATWPTLWPGATPSSVRPELMQRATTRSSGAA
jgi:AAA ATPase domain/Bacterial regulatory proteins, luxR family